MRQDSVIIAAQAPEAVFVYPSGDAVTLAAQINSLLDRSERLRAAKAGALRVAEKIFCWEEVAPRLVESVERALV